jgi:hypothetical protein
MYCFFSDSFVTLARSNNCSTSSKKQGSFHGLVLSKVRAALSFWSGIGIVACDMVFSDCGIGCICRFVGIGVGILGDVNGTGVGVFVVNDNKSLVVSVIDEVGESDSSLGGGVGVVIRRLMC